MVVVVVVVLQPVSKPLSKKSGQQSWFCRQSSLHEQLHWRLPPLQPHCERSNSPDSPRLRHMSTVHTGAQSAVDVAVVVVVVAVDVVMTVGVDPVASQKPVIWLHRSPTSSSQ